VREKGTSRFDRIFCVQLMNNIYRNPKETFANLIARILSVWANIKKNTPGIFAPESSGHCASLVGLQ